jgi:hypothetical protein
MQAETCFNFIDKDFIRIAGTRINIETVLRDCLQGASPKEIAVQYPTLSLEKIHAAILYYLANREQMGAGSIRKNILKILSATCENGLNSSG